MSCLIILAEKTNITEGNKIKQNPAAYCSYDMSFNQAQSQNQISLKTPKLTTIAQQQRKS
jgi:hypothetical protein